jgi:hypothetical protein
MPRPFNLEEAKAGAAVETVDGEPVRLFCFDRKVGDSPNPYNIVGLVLHKNGIEWPYTWGLDGKHEKNGTSITLVMATVKHSRVEWINVYSDYSVGYTTREIANENAKPGRLACIPIDLVWET